MTLDPSQPSSPPGTEPLPEALAVTPPPVPIPPAALPRRPSSSSRLLNALLVVAAVVAIGGVAFAVGRSTAPTAATIRGNLPGGFFQGGPGASLEPGQSPVVGDFPNGQGGGIGGLGGGLTISGTITSLTGDRLTIETASGQTIELELDADTAYRRSTEAAATDLGEGSNVEVQVDVAAGLGRPAASGDPASLGTASSITVVP